MSHRFLMSRKDVQARYASLERLIRHHPEKKTPRLVAEIRELGIWLKIGETAKRHSRIVAAYEKTFAEKSKLKSLSPRQLHSAALGAAVAASKKNGKPLTTEYVSDIVKYYQNLDSMLTRSRLLQIPV